MKDPPPLVGRVIALFATFITVALHLFVLGVFVAPDPNCGGWCMFEFAPWWNLVLWPASLGASGLVWWFINR
jgi:hypothetical protein